VEAVKEKFMFVKEKNPICDRLLDLKGDASIKSFAEKLELGTSTVYNYLHGRVPPADFVYHICDTFNINANWLISGEGPKNKGKGEHIEIVEQGEFLAPAAGQRNISVPFYDIDVTISDRETFILNEGENFAFPERWLTDILELDPKKLAITLSRDDSMEPTLRRGDVILIDLRQTAVIDEGIYIIKINNQLFAKRMQQLYNGSITIMCDNPLYQAQTVSHTEAGKLDIIGRAVWVGRQI
jgi:phage repressor protein C with HTH and peptisase S24 domain